MLIKLFRHFGIGILQYAGLQFYILKLYIKSDGVTHRPDIVN